MQKFANAIKFLMDNRRMIGLIVGSGLTLAGLPDYGEFITKVGEIR